MGDRFVVGFQDKPESPIVYLYSHWGGEAQDKILAHSLNVAQGRQNDPHYANSQRNKQTDKQNKQTKQANKQPNLS